MTETATNERLRKAHGDVIRRIVDDNRRQQADRIVPLFEQMFRRGQIDAELMQAGETYATYWHGARRTPGVTSAYGERSARSTGDNLIGEEWRWYCAQQLDKARKAIGNSDVADGLEKLVEMDATLDQIGHGYGYEAAKLQRVAGAVIAKLALKQLAILYGYIPAHIPRT